MMPDGFPTGNPSRPSAIMWTYRIPAEGSADPEAAEWEEPLREEGAASVQ
jgi:hypothetical protein